MTTGQCWWASSAEILEVEVEAEVLEVAATLEITEIEAAGMETEGLEVAAAPEITEMEAVETTPRPRPLSKGKGRVIYSDDEENMGESSRRPPTPRVQEAHELQQVRFIVLRPSSRHNFFPWHNYATQDDILRLCQSSHNLTHDIFQELVAELRRMNSRREESRHYAADDKAEHDAPQRWLVKPHRKQPGANRRSAAENKLSVIIILLTFLLTEISFRDV